MVAAPADVANELLARYAHSRSIADLKEAISFLEQALEATPLDTHAYITLLSNLGAALEALFSYSHDVVDLERATGFLQQALAVTPPDTSSYATLLNNLATGLSELGRRDDAVAASQEAVDIRRRLAEANPDAHLPDLAMSLNNLATGLSELGRRDDAVAASQEAVDIRRRLAEANPDAHLPDLAMSLNNLATGLSELGRRDDAVAASQEAVDIRRRLAEANPDAYPPDLAMSLNNLGIALSAAGRVAEAMAATEEAVQLYRRLAAADPAAHEPSLARALSNLGNRMSEAGRVAETMAAREEAVQLYRRLAAADPAAHEPIPGQLTLPGMPWPAEAVGGQATLPGLEFSATDGPAGGGAACDGAAGDGDLAAVAAELRALDGDGSRMAAAIRGALDMLLDGQHTGRYRWDQLHKTEKTHAGTLVEIALARALRLADGTTLDYTIAGADVDCKFSHRLGGWMIPPEADGKLLLLVQASDEDGTWSAGLLRATPENLRPAGNRDGKRALNERGRAAVRWLHALAPLQENALIRLPERDVTAIFASASGQQRVNELFRRAQRMRVSRTVVATVAMQDDYMKRVRGGGGARDQLRAEGIVIFGDYAGDQVLASALGLPRPGPGEFVSARLVPRPGERADYARSIRMAGADWLLASPGDPVGPAPALPR